MNNFEKRTKHELIRELQAAYRRIAELEATTRPNELSGKNAESLCINASGEDEAIKLKHIVDVEQIQGIMDAFQKITGAVFAIVDIEGTVLAASGWQDICVNFHRKNPNTADFCKKSDLYLSQNVKQGEYISYRCHNMLWDVATPIYINGMHLGNIFTGQFFYEDDEVDIEAFIRRADKYGFDREAYLAALQRVPRLKKENVHNLMDFLVRMTALISSLSTKNLMLGGIIREFRLTTDALRKSEQHFRDLVMQMPVPIIIFNAENNVETMNCHFENTFGYSKDDIRTVDEWLAVNTPCCCKVKDYNECMNNSTCYDLCSDKANEEYYIKCSDGSRKVVLSTCSKIGNHTIIIYNDITERIQVEDALLASEERLQNLYSLSPVGIFLCTKEGKYLSVNMALANNLGYSSADDFLTDVKSLPEQTLLNPAEWNDIVDLLIKNGKFTNREVQRRKKDGSVTWALMSMRVVEQDASISHFEGFTLDITEWKEVERALRDSEERLRTLINAMPDLVCFKDGHGKWRVINNFTNWLFDLGNLDWRGKTDLELAEENSFFHDVFHTCANTDEVAWQCRSAQRSEEVITRPDGDCKTFDIFKIPLFHQDTTRRALVVVGRDITQLKETRLALIELNQNLEAKVKERTKELEQKAEELQCANDRLKELDELKSGFVSAVSHEIRSPLTSILGFARLVSKDFTKYFFQFAEDDVKLSSKGSQLLDNLEIIKREGERLNRLIGDFLDLAKIESGRLQWQNHFIATNTLLEHIVSVAHGYFENKPDVKFVTLIPDSLPALWIDPDRLEQVLINIISNAIRFTERGEITLQVTVQPFDILKFSVSDTGIGIDKKDIVPIFQKFYQAKQGDTIRKGTKGTGLGLAICHQIVEHYGGNIWVESELGKGSTFYFTLPVHRESTC